jgi:hypothetical protein
MTDKKAYSTYAVLCELSEREFKKRLDLYPEELRYYVILANSIIGSENAKRVQETPKTVVEDGREFVAKLLAVASPGQDEVFREVLETYLIEMMKGELRYCCSNCAGFYKCLDLENLSVGILFKRRVSGEDTAALKKEIALEVEGALKRTPYVESDRAHILCKDFRHEYKGSTIGEVFGRYSDIALELTVTFGIDYKRIQREMIAVNMEFCEKGIGGGEKEAR